MIDLNSGSGASLEPKTLCDKINAVIDASLIERRKKEPVRTYLGASQIGEECLRKLGYSYSHTPVDIGRELTGRSIRIFDTGHAGEDTAALSLGAEDVPEEEFFRTCTIRWMNDAGFKLITRDKAGKQFGFMALDNRFGGHMDGIIIGNPFPDEIPRPVGWECKTLNQKSWNKIKKYGIKEASPVYYAQMITYMAYMELTAFLLTVLNKNTQELNHELVLYDAKEAQKQSDKAVTVIRAVEAGELLPRCTDNEDYFMCRLCYWRFRCWNGDV